MIRPLVGISACLTGQSVRYDGGDKYQPLILEQLSPHLEWRPFCPEVAAGLGLPRPPVQLQRARDGAVEARGVEDPTLEVSGALIETAQAFCAKEAALLCGFVLKSRSPSCALGTAAVLDPDASRPAFADGLFAAALRRAEPDLPCVDEEWLGTAARCRRFLTACHAFSVYRRQAAQEVITELEKLLEHRLEPGTRAWERLLAPGQNAALDERLRRFWYAPGTGD